MKEFGQDEDQTTKKSEACNKNGIEENAISGQDEERERNQSGHGLIRSGPHPGGAESRVVKDSTRCSPCYGSLCLDKCLCQQLRSVSIK